MESSQPAGARPPALQRRARCPSVQDPARLSRQSVRQQEPSRGRLRTRGHGKTPVSYPTTSLCLRNASAIHPAARLPLIIPGKVPRDKANVLPRATGTRVNPQQWLRSGAGKRGGAVLRGFEHAQPPLVLGADVGHCDLAGKARLRGRGFCGLGATRGNNCGDGGLSIERDKGALLLRKGRCSVLLRVIVRVLRLGVRARHAPAWCVLRVVPAQLRYGLTTMS